MQHKLVSLIKLRSTLDHLSDEDVVTFVDFMLKNSKNAANTVISGIFRQLYFDGESNLDGYHGSGTDYFSLLENKAQELIDKRNIKSNDNTSNDKSAISCIFNISIGNLPDSLLSLIASHLPLNDILLNWNHVNRKFIETGCKPETLQFIDWVFDSDIEYKIEQYPPKFKLDQGLSRIKCLSNNTNFQSIFDVTKLAYIKNITIDGGDNRQMKSVFRSALMKIGKAKSDENKTEYQKQIERIQLSRVLWYRQSQLGKFCHVYDKCFRHNCQYNNLKHIRIENVVLELDNDEAFYHVSNMLFQIIAPLSEKEIELKERLNKEITDEMKRTKQTWEIENIKKRIRNDVELQYSKKFDENDLNNVQSEEKEKQKEKENENENVNKNEWHSNIETLVISMSVHENFMEQVNWQRRLRWMTENFSRQRVMKSLYNLKSFGLFLRLRTRVDLTNALEYTSFLNLVGETILNCMCNKLVSLHLNPETVNLWELIENMNYPCTKDNKILNNYKQQSWFPANVKELCLRIHHDYIGRGPNENISSFWHKNIHCITFPKLKDLRIWDTMETHAYVTPLIEMEKNNPADSASEILVNNLTSLINNGLESLDYRIDNLDLQDIFAELDDKFIQFEREQLSPMKIIQMLNNIVAKLEMTNMNLSTDFIAKIELNVNPTILKPHFDNCIEKLRRELRETWKNNLVVNIMALCKELNFLYLGLSHFFENVMLGLKIQFELNQQELLNRLITYDAVRNLNKMIQENKILFESNSSRVVDCAVKRSSCIEAEDDDPKRNLLFSIMIKNVNKSEKNHSCKKCHMEPYFRFPCQYCQPRPWTEICDDCD